MPRRISRRVSRGAPHSEGHGEGESSMSLERVWKTKVLITEWVSDSRFAFLVEP